MIRDIVRFIEPFCDPDPNGTGTPPEYVITTLQLDSPNLDLHYAKAKEAVNRFKLRVRTYGEPGTAPVFLEVKEKNRGIIIKARTAIPFEKWNRDLVYNLFHDLNFKSDKEYNGFLKFIRLTREIGAEPVSLIRYVRESYFSRFDHYARVTFDRKLEYQPTSSWDSWGRDGQWISMDNGLAQNKSLPFSGVVLELKTLSDAPHWMIDLVRHFRLERTGNCKYSTSIWLESLFSGYPRAPAYADDLLIS